MKELIRYYYKYNNSKNVIIYGGYILAHNIIEAEEKIVKLHKMFKNPLFTKKDILDISDEPFFTNKKYYICVWMYYFIKVKGIIIAENEIEAKQIAISYIKLLGARPTDIVILKELTDDCYLTKSKVEKMYEDFNEKFCALKEDKEDYNG